MAQTIVGISQSKVLSNLDTYNHTALNASMYGVYIRLNELPPSGITITIKQNSSTIASTSVPAASQGVINLSAYMNCAINDVIGVVIASSTPSDQGPQAFKAILRITQGTVSA